MVGMSLARGDGVGFAGRQTLSAILGDGAVDNGAAVEALPGIKDEKEIREPLQHHCSFTLRTFHRFLLRWLRTQLMMGRSKSRAKAHAFNFPMI